uniref:Uncharacterized protein At1g07170/At2g30000 family n=1 Tax=Cajanus cajan TaxID=3821 RepID=A0A151T134_CAJCA|nr:Uncharacterized protein At1g07170/At2g30000 family [Cajanus cajan]
MAKHHPDLIMCRKQPGIAIGRLCEKCDGKWVDVSYAVELEYPMPTTARNAHSRRKIEMVAPKLLI